MTMETNTYSDAQSKRLFKTSYKDSAIVQNVFGWLAKNAVAISAYIGRRYQQEIDRLAFMNMLSLDAAILKDIGVSRDDVVWASKLPRYQNAALELEKIASLNRQKLY